MPALWDSSRVWSTVTNRSSQRSFGVLISRGGENEPRRCEPRRYWGEEIRSLLAALVVGGSPYLLERQATLAKIDLQHNASINMIQMASSSLRKGKLIRCTGWKADVSSASQLSEVKGNLSRNGWKFSVASCWSSSWGPVTLCNFLSNLSRNAPRNEKQEVCACALVIIAVKLRNKLLEGWYTVQWCCQLLQSVAKSRAEFYFVQRFAQQKKLRDNPCYTVQFSSNLSRNGIARQAAEKIAQCNRALTLETSALHPFATLRQEYTISTLVDPTIYLAYSWMQKIIFFLNQDSSSVYKECHLLGYVLGPVVRKWVKFN